VLQLSQWADEKLRVQCAGRRRVRGGIQALFGASEIRAVQKHLGAHQNPIGVGETWKLPTSSGKLVTWVESGTGVSPRARADGLMRQTCMLPCDSKKVDVLAVLLHSGELEFGPPSVRRSGVAPRFPVSNSQTPVRPLFAPCPWCLVNATRSGW